MRRRGRFLAPVWGRSSSMPEGRVMLKAPTLKMRTKMPKLSGISATREMIKAFVSETRALYAPARFSIEAVAVIFASGEMEMETKSRPSSAALAPTLALKKLVRASGTIGYSFLSGDMLYAEDTPGRHARGQRLQGCAGR